MFVLCSPKVEPLSSPRLHHFLSVVSVYTTTVGILPVTKRASIEIIINALVRVEKCSMSGELIACQDIIPGAVPVYLLPWTLHCMRCDSPHKLTIGGDYPPRRVVDLHGNVLMLYTGVCPVCLALYSYNSVEIDQTCYLLTVTRRWLIWGHRKQYCVEQRYLNELHQRLVTQFTSFQSEGRLVGIHRSILQQGVFLDWGLRYFREVRGEGLMLFRSVDEVVCEVEAFFMQEGMPSKGHRCTEAGRQHVQGLPGFAGKSDAEVFDILATYEKVLLVDGLQKITRKVCAFGRGKKARNPLTGLNMSLQCPKDPIGKSQFCLQHSEEKKSAPSAQCHAGTPPTSPCNTDPDEEYVSEEDSIGKLPQTFENLEVQEGNEEDSFQASLLEQAVQVAQGTGKGKSTADTATAKRRPKPKPGQKSIHTVTGELGCTKKVVVVPGTTGGVLMCHRACSVIVDLREMIAPEGVHFVLQTLYDLRERHAVSKVFFEDVVYDTSCQLEQSSRKHNVLCSLRYLLDRFHGTCHVASCQKNNMSNAPELCCINSSVCEQNNSQMGRHRYAVNRRKGANFLFFLVNAAEGHNRFILGGRCVAAITACQPVNYQVSMQHQQPTTWVVGPFPNPKARDFADWLAEQSKFHLRELSHLQYAPATYNPFRPLEHTPSTEQVALSPRTSHLTITPPLQAKFPTRTPATTQIATTLPNVADLPPPLAQPAAVPCSPPVSTSTTQLPPLHTSIACSMAEPVSPSRSGRVRSRGPSSTSPPKLRRTGSQLYKGDVVVISDDEDDQAATAPVPSTPPILGSGYASALPVKVEESDVPPSLLRQHCTDLEPGPASVPRPVTSTVDVPAGGPVLPSPATHAAAPPSQSHAPVPPIGALSPAVHADPPNALPVLGRRPQARAVFHAEPLPESARAVVLLKLHIPFSFLGRQVFVTRNIPVPIGGAWDIRRESAAFQALSNSPCGMAPHLYAFVLARTLTQVKGKLPLCVRKLWNSLFSNRPNMPAMLAFQALLVYLQTFNLCFLYFLQKGTQKTLCVLWLALTGDGLVPAPLVTCEISRQQWHDKLQVEPPVATRP